MTDYPMIYSAPMVRALIDGRKTQTRRIITPGNSLFNRGKWSALHKRQEWDWEGAWVDDGPSPMGNPGPYLKLPWKAGDDDFEYTVPRIYPVIQLGDRIWVKEAFRGHKGYNSYPPREWSHWPVHYHADGLPDPRDDAGENGRLRSPIHMPRWASRITLTVTDARPQRVSEISEADSVAEGVESGQTSRGLMWKAYDESPNCWVDTARISFTRLWNSIHGPDAWARNDWVWVYSFSVHHGNIDSMERRG
jgi:hypothetical protein